MNVADCYINISGRIKQPVCRRRDMSSSMLEQRSRFAMIGALMIIISLMFWYYMGSSLVSATKKYLEQVQTIEITCE